ncbi:MAG: PHP domain-containing protein [Synergistaceae bacterium]|nr:PHP domain-containing protein [Synergistaceae bacterium]
MGSRVDLHIHTDASDGTDSPQALLWNIQKAGIDTFAVTDHDTIRGAMAVKKIVPPGMKFIQGIEFSCIAEGGKCHILGLNYDENNLDFQEALRTGDELRHAKFWKRVEVLRSEFGITFTDDEMDTLLKTPSVGKPHLANMIVAKGFATDRQDAITRYIDKCRTGVKSKIDASFAVRAILSAGGIPVWAHPLGGEGEPELPEHKFRVMLQELAGYGLKGLECWYSKYKPMKCEWLSRWAERMGLCVSGGSDYHGTNKSIPLGRLNADNINIDAEKLTILRKV